MKSLLIKLAINLGFFALEKYTKNTDSKLDDKVLELSKKGVKYLANKDNNNVRRFTSNALNASKMKFTQKAKD